MGLVGKLFKNVLFVVIVFCTFSSCEDEISERKEIFSNDYELVDIVWGKMIGDEMSSKSFEETRKVMAEKYGTGYRVLVYPLEGYMQSSQFFSDDPELFNHLVTADPSMLSVPSEDIKLPNDLTWHLSSETKVPFKLETYNFAPDSYSTNQLITDVPCEVQCLFIIEEHHVAATYKARFKEINGTGIVEIIGKWKGVFYRCKDTKLKVMN